jgi:hypothetical protein
MPSVPAATAPAAQQAPVAGGGGEQGSSSIPPPACPVPEGAEGSSLLTLSDVLLSFSAQLQQETRDNKSPLRPTQGLKLMQGGNSGPFHCILE